MVGTILFTKPRPVALKCIPISRWGKPYPSLGLAPYRSSYAPVRILPARKLHIEEIPTMLETPEQKADAIIAGMVTTGLAMATIPTPFLCTVPFVGAMATGVVAIGACYGTTLTKDEGWKLVKEFFKAAGFTYAGTIVGGKLIGFALAATGIGYAGYVALDAATAAAMAYGVGGAAKYYFAGGRERSKIRSIMRASVKSNKRRKEPEIISIRHERLEEKDCYAQMTKLFEETPVRVPQP